MLGRGRPALPRHPDPPPVLEDRRLDHQAGGSRRTSRRLAATGYVLDQTPQLDRIDLTAAGRLPASEPPPLAEYLTYQVPILDLADLTDLDLGPLPAADRFAPVPAAQPRPWRQLHHVHDITL